MIAAMADEDDRTERKNPNETENEYLGFDEEVNVRIGTNKSDRCVHNQVLNPKFDDWFVLEMKEK